MQCVYGYDTPVGHIYITADDDTLYSLGYSAPRKNLPQKELSVHHTAYRQLSEYFSGRRKSFNIPLALQGTLFQKKVWNVLLNIPYGQTVSYQDVALAIGNKQACRAVGMANNKNPIAIIVPCHRVISKNGELTGYAGGLAVKEKLLQLEGAWKK